MEHYSYSVGTEAEAVDSFGVWHRCTVQSVSLEEGINVHFNGWSNKWDKIVRDQKSIRPVSETVPLVPRGYLTSENPKLSKLQAGDTVYEKLDGSTQLVRRVVSQVDPIQLFVTVDDARTVRPWQLFSDAGEERQPPSRKRTRKARENCATTQNPAPEPRSMPLEANELEFFHFIASGSGIAIQVGKFYSLVDVSNSVFICTRIFRKSQSVSVCFNLCQCSEGCVVKIVDSFLCTVDVEYVREVVNVKNVRLSSVVGGIISAARSRVVQCQLQHNDATYRREQRQHSLGVQMRQGVSGGISRGATRPPNPLNLGPFDPPNDTVLFGLSAKNNFRSEFKMSNFGVLDLIMGKHWDVKPLKEGDPNSFFKYVCKATLYLDKSNALKLSFSYSGSTFSFCNNYRGICKYP